MNIAQATTSGTRIGRVAESEVAARGFQRIDDNDNLLGVIYLLFGSRHNAPDRSLIGPPRAERVHKRSDCRRKLGDRGRHTV